VDRAVTIKVARDAVRKIQEWLDLLLAHELPVYPWGKGDYGCSLGSDRAYLYLETES
jgi:hypothetical protein